MHYCTNKEELLQIVMYLCNNRNISCTDLKRRLELASSWFNPISGLTYLFSQILERKKNEGEDCIKLLNIFYDLEEKIYFIIQEIDANFITYMMRCQRNDGLNLEDEIVRFQNSIGNYRYDKSVRK